MCSSLTFTLAPPLPMIAPTWCQSTSKRISSPVVVDATAAPAAAAAEGDADRLPLGFGARFALRGARVLGADMMRSGGSDGC
jgi:hypothetical protein